MKIVIDQHGIVVVDGGNRVEQRRHEIGFRIPNAGGVLADTVHDLFDVHPPAPERDDPGMDAVRRAESERLLPAAASAFWMARAFCPVPSALFFQASCSSCRHLILGTKKGHFFFSEEMS